MMNNKAVLTLRSILGILVLAAMLPAILPLTSGCAKTADSHEAPADESAPAAAVADSDSALPRPQVPASEHAATVGQKHPHLAMAVLVYARLADLPEGVLMRSDELTITAGEIDAQIADAPKAMQADIRKNVFFMFEELATERLLVAEATRNITAPGLTEEQRIERHFSSLVESAKVSDEEISEFYQANREMVGSRPFELVKPQIAQYLLQQKRQDIVMEHIRTFGQRTPVLVSASWIAQKAALATDNAMDKARANGKPSFVSFGSERCLPCRQMAPTREAVSQKYADKANMVYVDVDKEAMLASRFNISAIPLLLFFDAKGSQTLRHEGTMSQQEIEQILDKLIPAAAGTDRGDEGER